MKMLNPQNGNSLLLFLFISFTLFTSHAQVGINTITPDADAMLDIVSTDKGALLPRVSLSQTTNAAPLGSHTAGMLLYNTASINDVTPGYYYNNGTQWVRMDVSGQSDDWKTTGNSGTTAGTNFLGTTDAQALQIRSNNTERMRILSNGQVSVNNATPAATDRFSVTGASGEYAVSAYASGTAPAVYGFSNNSDAVVGIASGIGLYGYGGIGLFAYSPSSAGGLIRGQGTSTGYYTDSGLTVHGNNGISARGASATGHGLIAAGNAQTPLYLTGGTGVSAYGQFGAFGYTMTNGSTGVVGGSNGSSIATDANGSGIAGSGPNLGVFGYCPDGTRVSGNRGNAGGRFTLDSDNDPTTTNSRANATLAGFDNIAFNSTTGTGYGSQDSYFGGYFSGGSTNSGTPSYAYAGLRYNTNTNGTSGTDFKIVGPGSNSTIFKDNEGTPRIMFSPEAPEILFQDFGTGKLTNGQAYIEIDPTLRAGLHIDNEHPLKVYITLEGDCNGVYVTDKSINGFMVKELGGGRSNAPFAWQIVANRADTRDDQGNIQSKHVGVRLPVGPGPLDYESKKLDIKSEVVSESTASGESIEKYLSKKPSGN